MASATQRRALHLCAVFLDRHRLWITPHFSEPAIQHFRAKLLEWYRQHGRHFPWRKRYVSNYNKIIAEVLLQRTRAETVAGFFPIFVSRYPSWPQLAAANEDEPIALIRPVGVID